MIVADPQTPTDQKTPIPAETMEQDDAVAINLEAFPGLTEDYILDWAKKCNESWEKFFNGGSNPQQKRIELYNKMFMCQNADPRQPHLPIPNSIVETLHANLMRVLTQRPKVIEAKPKFPTADNEQQQLMEDLVNQEIVFQKDARKKLSEIAKSAEINEYAIVRADWEICEYPDINPQYQLVNGAPMLISSGEIVKKRGCFNYYNLPVLSCAFDPDCITSLPEAPWFRYRERKGVSQLLIMQQQGKLQNVDALIDKATATKQADEKDKLEKQKEALGAGRGEGPEKKVQVDEFYALIAWESQDAVGKNTWQAERFHFMVAGEDGGTLIYFDKSDLKPDRNPVVLARVQVRPDSLIGNGALLPVVDLEEQANLSLGRKRDLVTKAADNPGFYTPASGFDPSKTRARTGGWIMVADAKQINRLPVDSEPIRILNEDIGESIQMMRESTPANEQYQGNAPQEGTATQATIDYQVGGTRFAEIVDTFSNDLFPQLAREFLWQAKAKSIDGDLFVSQSSIDGQSRPVMLADLAGEWDFIASSMQTEANKKHDNAGKLEMAELAVKVMTTTPQLSVDDNGQPQAFKFWKLLVDELFPTVGIRNGKTYLMTLPPPPPMPPPGQPMPPHQAPGPQHPGPGPGGPPPMSAPMPGMGPMPQAEANPQAIQALSSQGA